MPLAASGDLADFAKFGYNADAIVIEANDFGDGHSVVTAVDKAQAIAGTLVYYQSTPAFNFRALTPAQMHDAIARRPDVVHGLHRRPDLRRHHAEHDPRHRDDQRPLQLARPTPTSRVPRQHLRAELAASPTSRAAPARWRPTT